VWLGRGWRCDVLYMVRLAVPRGGGCDSLARVFAKDGKTLVYGED
jgi:hypothetical protein